MVLNSRTSQPDTATKSLDVEDLPSYSSTNNYLDKDETHEKTAIGQGPQDSVQDRVARAEKEIKESEEKLKG